MGKFVFIIVLSLVAIDSGAQGFLNTEYVAHSDMNDRDGEKHGGGDMLRVCGRYTLPLSVKTNAEKQPSVWNATINASMAWLDNDGEALQVNPDRILNASLNVSHSRPLSGRWRLMASLGVGVYAAPDELGWRSLLANGVAIFVYRLGDRLSIGVGGGLTNSYGAPMLLPMGYLSWSVGGRYRLNVDMSNGMRINASAVLSRHFRLELTAIEMDGMSAVRRIDGRSMIYSSMSMKSRLTPTLQLSEHSSAYIGIGGCWLRSVSISDRSLKAFFKQFGSDDNKYRFRTAVYLTAGVRCKF